MMSTCSTCAGAAFALYSANRIERLGLLVSADTLAPLAPSERTHFLQLLAKLI